MVLTLVLLAAAPPLPTPISAPFGHFGAVIDAPARAIEGNDPPLPLLWEGCEPKAAYPQRFVSGAMRALEQIAASFTAAPGAEKRLFKRAQVLAALMSQLREAAPKHVGACAALPVTKGWELALTSAPKQWCEAAPEQTWFFARGRPAVLFAVSRASDRCDPRVSASLFDQQGLVRARFHADWGGALAVELLGERCQLLYQFDADTQTFVPQWNRCS